MPPSWTDHPPRLTSAFVELREVALADACTLFEFLSEPLVAEHLSAPPRTLDAFVGFIAWARQERAAARSITFGIVPHGLEAPVGIVQLRALDPKWIVAEWGFAVGAAFWGTGVFPEAAQLAVRFAFEELHADRLEARAVVANGRGNGALQKIGAVAESCLAKSFKRADGCYDEQLLWSLRADDWRQRKLFPGERFDPTVAKIAIREAVRAARAHLASCPVRTSSADVAPYPFLLSRPAKPEE